MPEVIVMPDSARAGLGLTPASEPRRAALPQHARFCPVLEDGSRMGYLVYPPLAENESYQVRYIDEGVYEFTFYHDQRPVFVLLRRPSAGGGEAGSQELVHFDEQEGVSRQEARTLVDALVINLHTPAGGVGMRGSHDFVTPHGWDTLYTGVLNDLRRPMVPWLAVRVETDWFRQPTEFRYVLQKGDAISAAAHAPVGQVFFVPREEVSMTLASREEAQRLEQERLAYWARKPQLKQRTRYGSRFDRQYRDESLEQQRSGSTPSDDAGDADDER